MERTCVPVAAALPNATFVGVDFAARPVARATRMASDLGLANVRLLQLDLREFPADIGQLRLHHRARPVLVGTGRRARPCTAADRAPSGAPNGVAFVSYNTLPGCHMRRAVWEMLKFHTREIADKPAKVAAARSLIALVATPVVGR